MLAGDIAGTAEPSGREELEGFVEELPDQLSTALAGTMVSQSHFKGRDMLSIFCLRVTVHME